MSLLALKMIQDYLQNRKPKLGHHTVFGTNITSGVLQGSVLKPLLFSNFLCDLFLEDENNYFGNYADGTTGYIVGGNTTELLRSLASLAEKLFTWFANNQMKVNHGKCHLLLSSPENTSIQIETFTIICVKSKKAAWNHY